MIAGHGTPIDGRLSGKGQTFTADGKVFITDLVFGNPRGRTGNIRLRREERCSWSCGSRTSVTSTSTS